MAIWLPTLFVEKQQYDVIYKPLFPFKITVKIVVVMYILQYEMMATELSAGLAEAYFVVSYNETKYNKEYKS